MDKIPGNNKSQYCTEHSYHAIRLIRNVGIAVGTAGKIFGVIKQYTHALSKSKTADQKIISSQTDGQTSQNIGNYTGHSCTDNHGKYKGQMELHAANRRRISPD